MLAAGGDYLLLVEENQPTGYPPGVADLALLFDPPAALADRREASTRGHRAIENRLHRVEYVTLGEDQSTLHAGQGPTAMAFLRDAALSLLRREGIHQIAARLREHA